MYLILQVKIWFQNRRMKWKRSRKAQQEAKSKDNHQSDEKRSEPKIAAVNPASTFNNGTKQQAVSEKAIANNNNTSNFQFTAQNHPSHHQQRHVGLMIPSKDFLGSENDSSLNRQQNLIYNESEDMIWRVV